MKRKNRDKIDKDQVNLLQPIDISIFGTVDDPCFGKHHDPHASECGRCGDAQICFIVCSQGQHAVRAGIESKGSFKDIDSEVDNFYLNLKEIEERIVSVLERRGDRKATQLVKMIESKFDPKKILDRNEYRSALIKVVKKSTKLKAIKKEGTRYIKLK